MRASVEDYGHHLRTMRGESMRMFVLICMERFANETKSGAYLSRTMRCFRDACKDIVEDPAFLRLGTLIRTVFKDAGLENRFESPGPEPLSDYDAIEQALTTRD